MSRQARQQSRAVRQSRRAFQRIRRQARPLSEGEILVVRHLLQPIRQQRHFSQYKDEYLCQPRYRHLYVSWGPPGRYRERSRELARRVASWERQLPHMIVYHADCWLCATPCQMYVKGFVPILHHDWPPGVTLHVAFDPTAAEYPAVRREVGRIAHDPHVVLSHDLARIQAIILS
jgi:hypothetical protein